MLGDSDECRHHDQFISTARCRESKSIAFLQEVRWIRENRLEPSVPVGMLDGSWHGLAPRKLKQRPFKQHESHAGQQRKAKLLDAIYAGEEVRRILAQRCNITKRTLQGSSRVVRCN
jgi:hypothetical protein